MEGVSKNTDPTESMPLVVDLDFCLLKTDCLLESIVQLIREKPWMMIFLPFWLLKGRFNFKDQIAKRVHLDVSILPLRPEVLELIQQAKKQGRLVALATASHHSIAEKINDHLQLFDEIFASKTSNLKGEAKARALAEAYGEGAFEYLGDSKADLKVWKISKYGRLISHSQKLKTKVLQQFQHVNPQPLTRSRSTLQLILQQARLHQWSKNILVFMPIILSHQYSNFSAWLHSIVAFFAFSFVSSSVYMINDLFDLTSDRHHPENQFRPFASGDLSLVWAPFLIFIFLGTGISLAFQLGWKFELALLGYFALTSVYSFFLKKLAVADLIVLATLYSWRVLAGSFASGIQLSQWFLTFAIFFFFSLAILKRCAELKLLEDGQHRKNRRRGYFLADLPILNTAGVSAGFLSVLILALYLNDEQTKTLHAYPQFLFLVCPLLLFWITRLWLVASRGKMPTDPVIFALRDNISYALLLLLSVVWLFAQGSLTFILKAIFAD